MTKEELKTLRKSLNLSQSDFGWALNPVGYSRQYISLLERGERVASKRFIYDVNKLMKEKLLKND